MIRVSCHLTDCVRWNNATDDPHPHACDCSHPDKEMYMEADTCPLYKKDWSSLDTSDLANRFRRRGVAK